jgi:hypothetical protein
VRRAVRDAARGSALLLAAVGMVCCTTASRFAPAAPQEAAAGRERLSEICRKAWVARRFKALYSVEVSPVVGAVQRGYLSLFWDGNRLLWRTSLPMAGQVGEGSLERGVNSPGGLASALSSRLNDGDALAVLLGAPECPALAPAVEWDGSAYRFLLEGEERTVLLEPPGVTGMGLPGGISVRLTPGEEVPSGIEVVSWKGKALLKLQAVGGWPTADVPPGGG